MHGYIRHAVQCISVEKNNEGELNEKEFHKVAKI